MSTTIDERVLEMRFDNKQFEQNVSDSMSTLDKLKQKLNLTGASKGLENVDAAARNVNMSGLGTAVETVSAKFSALSVMGVTALANLTNSAVNAGKRIASALTIDPIKTGFSEYETQINAVQTILANTSSKGTTIDDVNKALDTLNTYADKTIYNFTEMTRNIGTFTAAGVDLDTSVSAIQGIANLAAVSGSTSQQASTAMYQLSQALASGTVKLTDWNSVVNAGMGGEVFQNALKRTAKVMGTDVDALIKKYGSFRETLSSGWLTTDILTETLNQFTLAAKEGSEQWEEYKKSLTDKGYTEAQAEEILKMANTATDAATKVKTFTQLWDTLKESAQSGWTQTWEILVGDFEEAKSMLTKVSDVLGEMIGKSAESRNELLQGWKDAGGRDDLIAALTNAFKGLMSIIKPIKEAFREIFPPITVDQLVKFTKSLRVLTEKFTIIDIGAKNVKKSFQHIALGVKEAKEHNDKIITTINNVKRTFKGLFAAADIVVDLFVALGKGAIDIVKNFKGIGGSILGATASIGDWLVNLRNTVKETDIFGVTVNKITGYISTAIGHIKKFGSSVKEYFQAKDYSGFVDFFSDVWDIIQNIGSKIGDVFSKIGSGLANTLTNPDFFNTLNSGLYAGILVGIQKFIWGLSNPLDGVSDLLENVTGILDDVRGCFEAYQNQLKAGTLLKIAGAIAMLAAAILVIACIKPEALDKSLGAITVLFAELLGSLAIFTKLSGNMKGVIKASVAMTSMSVAIVILAAALKILSTMNVDELGRGLVSIGVLMAELAAFLNFAKFGGKTVSTATGIVILSAAMIILAKAVNDFSTMEWTELGKSLAAIGGLLLILATFTKLTGNAKHVVSTAVSMTILGAALHIFVPVVKEFAQMQWDEIGRGLTVMAGALAAITLAMNLMPKNMLSIGVGFLAVSAAMKVLSAVISSFSGMSWEEIGKGLATMGGALLELAIALRLMNGTVSGAAALIIAATALAIITPVMKTLGGMSWEAIGKGLVTLAGAFTVIGVAGLLLTPLIPTLLRLAGAFALFGIATLGIGAGLVLISAGLSALGGSFTILSTSVAASATAIVAALSIIVTGVMNLLPGIVRSLGDVILAFCQVVIECAPAIAKTILVVITEMLNALATYTPQIVSALMKFVIGVLDVFAENLPQLIVSAVNVIGAFFQGIVNALSGIDTTNLIKGIIGIGLMSALMFALSAIAGLVPGAMVGVLGVGLVIAEMAIVLAAVGALAQLPGLHWLIDEGGELLASLGAAIGKFFGGIAGGFVNGISSQFPQIATDLSDFMTNIQPFIEGAKSIDSTMMEGVKALAETILILTAANILEGITAFIPGVSSLSSFGDELAGLAISIKGFAENLGTFDESKVSTVTCAANAIKALAQAANEIPNEGGWAAKIFGDNSLAAFGEKLPGLATNLNSFVSNLGIFTDEQVTTVGCAGNAIKALAQAANEIPNEGGWAAKIFGDNSLATFGGQLPELGSNLAAFVSNLGTFTDAQVATVGCAGNAVKALAQASNSIDGQPEWAKKIFGDNGLSAFGDEMTSLGTSLKDFVGNLGTFTEAQVATVRSAVNAIKALTGLADADLKGAQKNLPEFSEALPGLAKGITSFATDMPSSESVSSAVSSIRKIITVIGEIANANSGVLSTFADNLKKVGEKAVDKFVSAFTSDSAKTDLKDAAKKLGDKVVDGIEAKESAVKKAAEALADKAVDGLDSLEDDGKSAGKDLGSGLVSGIEAKETAAYNAGYALGQAAVQGEKDGQASNSPSKLTMLAGRWLGEGLVIGIEKMGKSVYSAGSDLGKSATKSISSAISRITDVIDSDMDVQPTITPVLDLSNVRSGAGTIAGLFDMNPSMGVLANVGAISSTMNRIQNGSSNDDVVSAINKLRKDLGGVRGDTYSINGITYDDGSNIADAVKTLTRAVKVGRRV